MLNIDYRQDKYIKPYEDNRLVYDKFFHRYLIKRDFIASIFGDEIMRKDEQEWKTLQFQLSDNIYNFIYSFKSGSRNYDIMEYELAFNSYYREALSLALLYQAEYALTTSGDTVQLQHGVNIGIDKEIKIDTLRGELMVAYKAELVLYQRGLLESTVANDKFDYETLYRKDY